jgi:hypothetical protein
MESGWFRMSNPNNPILADRLKRYRALAFDDPAWGRARRQDVCGGGGEPRHGGAARAVDVVTLR